MKLSVSRLAQCLLVLLLLTLVVPLAGAAGNPQNLHGAALAATVGTQYHSYAERTEILRWYAQRYEGLARVYSIGKSYLGRDLWMIEITNSRTGSAASKPGIYVDGNTHGTEITGGEAALYSVRYLLENYGKDPEITELVDTKAFYILPSVNVDGADMHVTTLQGVSTNLRPYDNDRDGIADEDPPDDVNGDGWITQMRRADPNGSMVPYENDPRLLRSKQPGDAGPFYTVWTEGLNDDGDGRYNEDGSGGGTNLNRNYPGLWEPNKVQSGSGAFPFSEPETRAIGEFFASHPNLCTALSYHTWAGAILRPFAGAPWGQMPAEDQELFLNISQTATELTGYRAVSTFESFPGGNVKRAGTHTDWVYWDMGIVGFAMELWHAPENEQVTWFTLEEDWGALRFSDQEMGGAGYVNWTPFRHPQLGEVEIGGWTKFANDNPPPGPWLEKHLKKGNAFALYLGQLAPRVDVESLTFEPTSNPEVFDLVLVVKNNGGLATNLTREATLNRLAQPILATLRLNRYASLVGGKGLVSLGSLNAGAETTYKWQVRVGGKFARAEVVVESEKGGTSRKAVSLGDSLTPDSTDMTQAGSGAQGLSAPDVLESDVALDMEDVGGVSRLDR